MGIIDEKNGKKNCAIAMHVIFNIENIIKYSHINNNIVEKNEIWRVEGIR